MSNTFNFFETVISSPYGLDAVIDENVLESPSP
ncbi:hypothetical protein TNCV_3771741, partial [Trichonephila clavipes]